MAISRFNRVGSEATGNPFAKMLYVLQQSVLRCLQQYCGEIPRIHPEEVESVIRHTPSPPLPLFSKVDTPLSRGCVYRRNKPSASGSYGNLRCP